MRFPSQLTSLVEAFICPPFPSHSEFYFLMALGVIHLGSIRLPLGPMFASQNDREVVIIRSHEKLLFAHI